MESRKTYSVQSYGKTIGNCNIEDRVKDERASKKFRTKDIMSGKLDLIYCDRLQGFCDSLSE